MTLDFDFPSKSDFTFEGDDFCENVRNLTNILTELNAAELSDFSDKIFDFLKTELPVIWKIILASPHPSRSLIRDIQLLEDQFCLLCTNTNLMPQIINAITAVFENQPKKYKIYPCEKIPENQQIEFLKGKTEQEILHPERPNSSSIVSALIQNIISSGIFYKAKELIDNDSFTVEQDSALVKLFSCIEQSISEKYIFSILHLLSDVSIKLIHTQSTDINAICDFLSNFAPMIPERSDEILSCFCELAGEKYSAVTRLLVITDMIKIINSIGIGNSAEIVKKSMISAINTSSQINILQNIYEFLPKLSSLTQFSDDDLYHLLVKARSGDDILANALVSVVKSIDRNVDVFANQLLDHDILSPGLYCAVIGKTESVETTRKLFHRLLSLLDKFINKETVQEIELNDRLKMHIKEEDGNLLTLMQFLLLYSSDIETARECIVRAFEMPVLPPELIPMLLSFSKKLNDSNSTPAILTLFKVVIQSIESSSQTHETTDSLIMVLTQWINNSNDINTSQLLKQLSNLNFQAIGNTMPCLINSLISKSHDKTIILDFLFKILSDSVPPKHASWLIRLIFSYMHDNKNNLGKCFDIIMGHIDNKSKFKNGVYLLYNAALYEADFYLIGEKINYIQNIILHMKNDTNTEIQISLHPFHSARRVFAEVAHALNISIDQFQLILTNNVEDQYLKFEAPLQTIQLGIYQCLDEDAHEYSEKPLEIRIENNDDDHTPNPLAIQTPFLDLLESKRSKLFDLLAVNDFESEILFQILQLFPPLHINPNNPLQEVAIGKCSDPMVFKDSVRIFPYAIVAFSNSSGDECDSHYKEILLELASHNFDVFGTAAACRELFKSKKRFIFEKDEIKKCLIDCKNKQIRIAAENMISDETNSKYFCELTELTLLNENRTRSQSFYRTMKRLKLSPETYVPFYKSLTQFETSYYADYDQTFVSLLELIPDNQEMIDLTIQRLFSPPTCKNETLPFIHTTESWTAALKFIKSELSIPIFHSLLNQISDVSLQKGLSSDFTYHGRCGIVNMGATCYISALLQVLNACQHFSVRVFSKNPEVLSPFALELRKTLARLRFSRNIDLHIHDLVKTINPKFDTSIQQDIEEFFNISILTKLADELKKEDDITEKMKIVAKINISSGGKIVSSNEESFYYLLLQTKHLKRLDEAFKLYFEEENIEGGYNVEGYDKKQPAGRWISISKWPDYLVLQLQRWEFSIETGERHKLNHEFAFPVDLKGEDIKCNFTEQKCNFDYTLASVIIHQGTAYQGHYTAIVQGDDGEWYFCDDKKIQYFDINELANFAYGKGPNDDSQTPEDIFTGYLLFYKKKDLENIDVKCPPDLESEINEENKENWPNTIFFSKEFAEYALDLISKYSEDSKNKDSILDIAFAVLFKIAVYNEEILNECCSTLTSKIKNEKDACSRLFDYIENKIGNTLEQYFSISEKITNSLSNLIAVALNNLKDSTNPIISILKCVTGQFPKRMFCTFLFDTISNACQTLHVDWSKEDEVLTLMLNVLSIQLNKEIQRNVQKSHVNAMNNILGIFSDIINVIGCSDVILSVFDIQRMNKVGYIYKKCENFQRLLLSVNTIRPDIFQESEEANQITNELLSAIKQPQSTDTEEPLILDLDFMFPSLQKLLFCDNKNAREKASDVLKEMIGSKNTNLIAYMNESIQISNEDQKNKDSSPALAGEENTISLFICGLLPELDERIKTNQEESCIEYANLLVRLCNVFPNSLLRSFPNIVSVYVLTKNEEIKRKLLKVIHHLISYDQNLMDDDSFHDIFEKIINSNITTSSYATRLLAILYQKYSSKVNHSVLSGACVNYYLNSEYDANADLLISLLRKGLEPSDDNVDIPHESDDFLKLRIANELWKCWPDRRSQLSEFILSSFKLARPISLYMNSAILQSSIKILQEYCPDELRKVIDELNS